MKDVKYQPIPAQLTEMPITKEDMLLIGRMAEITINLNKIKLNEITNLIYTCSPTRRRLVDRI